MIFCEATSCKHCSCKFINDKNGICNLNITNLEVTEDDKFNCKEYIYEEKPKKPKLIKGKN